MMFNTLNVPTYLAKLLSIILTVLIFAPVIPLANILGVILMAFQLSCLCIKIYFFYIRDYLPPMRIYVCFLNIIKYGLVVHLFLGAYMYGCILNPKPILGIS